MTQLSSLPARIQALFNPEFINSESIHENVLDLPVNAIKGIGPTYKLNFQRLNIINIQNLSEMPSSITAEDLQIPQKLLEKFWLSAQLVVHYLKHGETEREAEKIVIAGLDKAGKTAIIRSIQNMKTIDETTATFDAEISNFLLAAKMISFWDLGGQRSFRDVFTKPESVHFSGLSLLIFVFDVQAPSRAVEGLEYLDSALRIATFLRQRPKLVIFFHKYDREHDEKTISAFETYKQDLSTQINALIEKYNLPSYTCFDTSIYNIATLIQAFSKALTKISPVGTVLNDVLEFYSKEQEVLGTFLMSDQGLIIAEYIGKIAAKTKDNALLQALRSIQYNPDERILSEELESGLFVTLERMLINDVKLFLTTVSESPPRTKSSRSSILHEMLSPWLANLFADL